MESLQLVKEQLKIKAAELRKFHEENEHVKKQIKDLITFNQTEVKKLKEVVKHAEAKAAEQKSEARAAHLAKHAGIEAGKKEKEEEDAEISSRMDDKMKAKMLELSNRAEKLREWVEKEKSTNKKFSRERDVLIKELNRLRKDTGTTDNLKKKIEGLKTELTKAKKTSMSSGAVTENIVTEKDRLITKYEDML